jgi:hypothetical protein
MNRNVGATLTAERCRCLVEDLMGGGVFDSSHACN